ncbi:MAG: YihY/virulence factor BrkB family protein, partial [Victivallaceae bacterium]
KTLTNSANGVVAGIGALILLWTFLKVIGNIEQSFNDIWGIIKGRSIFRRISDYMSLLVIGPILIIMGGSITIWVNMVVHNVAATLPFADSVGKPVAGLLIKMLPFAAAWGLFTFIYIFVPNTKVKFRSAFFAALISGTLYQFLQIGYIKSQVWLTSYNTVYGSLSAFPLFLIWMQLNWLLVLFGTVLSFAHQNINTIEFKPGEIDLSARFRSRLRLLLVRLIAERFVKQQPLHTDESLAQSCRLPTKYIQSALYELVEAHVVISAVNDSHEMRENQVYLPAVPLEKLTIAFVESAVEKLNDVQSPEIRGEGISEIDSSIATMAELAYNSPANVNLSSFSAETESQKAVSIKNV